ncbi:MAG TPA: hydrophobe/amphiphile efflux-1 family RND transporter [Lentisphaeria bacterium]|nr:MAG: RND transporter [Lentisphaerae bacterium GWF2_38_69]HBM16618.1 hydrophobe/amphiphile efflux-1 family RND transporter [Lentisphaeria bacterium]
MFSLFFINRPKFAFVLSIIIVIAGIIAIKSMPIAIFPNITPPQVQITTTYPGADAASLEKTTVIPLEQQINGVEDMIYMDTQCSDSGNMTITVSFDVGSNPDMNVVNVNNRVSIALPQLPETVQRQGITVKQQNSNILLLINIYSPTDEHDSIFLTNFACLNLLDEVSRIPGVGNAQVMGSLNYAMRIWIDSNKLASLQITPSDLINAVNEQNKQVPSGQIGGQPSEADQQFQITILSQSRMDSVEQFENIIVRENPDGSMIRVKDVAKVTMGAQAYTTFGQFNGKPSANLAVYQLPSANALEISQKVREIVKKQSESFPKGVAAEIVYDTTLFVSVSLKEVVITLIEAIILVILVVFIFLQDWRATLIPSIAIPVSLVGTFSFLLALGYSINTITLFAMILAIGIVVDDAIVVIENVYRIMEEEHLDPIEATKKGMLQVTGPVIATSLVLWAVFIPVAFIPGITGELYRQFAVTIAASVGISAFNALTLSPALCATFLKPKIEGKKEFILFRWFNKGFDKISEKYLSYVAATIRNLPAVVIFTVLLLAMIYFLYAYLPTGFIPNEDQGSFIVELQMPSGAALTRTEKVMESIREIVQKADGVADTITVNGYSLMSNMSTSNASLLFVVLKDWDQRKTPELQINAITSNIRNILQKDIPEGMTYVYQLPPIPGLGSADGFQFELEQKSGNNPQEITQVLNNFIYLANQQPELAHVYSLYRSNVPKVHAQFDIDKLKKLQISLDEAFGTIQSYFGSSYVNQFDKFGKVYQVYIQAESKFRATLQNIENAYVMNKRKEIVPMDTVLTLKPVLAPDIIYHYNMFANAEIEGAAAPGYSTGQAIDAMERVVKEVMPLGMQYEWTGTAYQEIIAGNQTIIVFMLAIIFIYLFLVAKYESWMLSLAVMLSVPVAILGALAAMWLAGIDNNIYAQVGFVLLFGMSSKTAILMVEFADKEYKSGKNLLDAAYEAAKIRFRAVIMTATAFILGVVPLLIATGPGANSRKAIGFAVFGGMLLDAILGTLRIPSFYVLMEKIIGWAEGKREPKIQKSDDSNSKPG